MEDAAKAYYRQGWDGWPPSVGLPIGVALQLLDRHRYALGALELEGSTSASPTSGWVNQGAAFAAPLSLREVKP
ncbi:hypothetical protein [Meiothermus sp. CFH 77666]|uniref:hypothetical protein n=1 Tax=Meiothermus sp. CFH 77666 TaxID=2817942 RepID=UPI001AA02749|nr:hypothetical protein [Meiothermus sp. CFH 77666]MBO1438606.1 hypothetical protein [Meiothermus sp. CFH 77666]